ncbi:hypothetical protein LQV63_12325 [Paenibacillus profundus]|uniref:SH3 domain-containing protein n=1 Tax=Paenibacillus profundus TaxID=1173085 RepID=A0ABS8YDM3_9BACL|nr:MULTISPECIES: hypothetical protein [Paenibacillus]MCE5170096.1 hypothetical protein [Paenibacillus profundus]
MNSKFLRKQMICGLMAALMVGAWALPASAQTAAASDAASTSVTSEVTGTADEAQTTTDIEEPAVPEQTVVSVKEPEIRVDLTKSIVFYRAVGGESIGSLEAQTIYVERTETDAKGQKWGQVHTWLGYVWVRL